MSNANITVRTEIGERVDADVRERANAVAEQLSQHIGGLSVDSAELSVLFDHFQIEGQRGNALIRLNGSVNGENVDSKHEWAMVPPRRSLGGKIIASAVTNTMHGGSDGIRRVTIDNVLSASTATFCGEIDDTLGIETSSVRAGMKAAGRWALIGFSVSFAVALAAGYKMVMNDKDADMGEAIMATLLGGGMFACLPAAAAASIRMLFIPGNDIENSPYGTNLMNFVGLKSGSGVKGVFAAFAIGAVALTVLLIGAYLQKL